MGKFENAQELYGIRKFDGYKSRPIWTAEGNKSTYYDYNTDTQCYVPTKSAKEVLESLGLEP